MRRLILLIVVLVAAGSFLALRPATTTDAGGLEGVWKLVTFTNADGEETEITQPQLLFFTAGHYAILSVLGAQPRELLPEEPTDEQRLAAWRRFFANAGTYEVDGDAVRRKVIVAKDPAFMAEQAEFSYTFEVDGDTLTMTQDSGAVLTYTRLE